MVSWTITRIRFGVLGFSNLRFHLPGNCTDDTGGGKDGLWLCRRVMTGVLMRESIWFNVVLSRPVGESEVKSGKEQLPVGLMRI